MSEKTTYITSRYGRLNSIAVYQYRYTGALNQNSPQKQKFIHWLTKNPDLAWFGFIENGFETTEPMPVSDSQYILTQSRTLIPPYDPLEKISAFLNRKLDSIFKDRYKKFRQIYILDSLTEGVFCIHKGFTYNVEIFEDGRFLIHFSAQSAITHQGKKELDHILSSVIFKAQNASLDNIPFTLHDLNTRNRRTIYPLHRTASEDLKKFQRKFGRAQASFDYEFVNEYYPEHTVRLINGSKLRIQDTVLDLGKVSAELREIAGIQMDPSPFLSVRIRTPAPPANLKIGSGKLVSKLSAIYYEGFINPVKDRMCLVLTHRADPRCLDQFTKLVDQHFNRSGKLEWLRTLGFESFVESVQDSREFAEQCRKAFVVVISGARLPDPWIKILRSHSLGCQVFSGDYDPYSLSNFAVQCLRKMGGIPAVMKNNLCESTCGFIGIDFGHASGGNDKQKYSRLLMVALDGAGLFRGKYTKDPLPLNEALRAQEVAEGLSIIKKRWLEKESRLPERIIIHRDGRLHSREIEMFQKAVLESFGTEKLEIVEIIKSGHPYMVHDDSNQVINPEPGTFWMLESKQYALLITNDQNTAQGALLNPVVIRRRYGSLPFHSIVSQVYWLCLLHSPSIYNPTRIPATIGIANKLARTGKAQSKR